MVASLQLGIAVLNAQLGEGVAQFYANESHDIYLDFWGNEYFLDRGFPLSLPKQVRHVDFEWGHVKLSGSKLVLTPAFIFESPTRQPKCRAHVFNKLLYASVYKPVQMSCTTSCKSLACACDIRQWKNWSVTINGVYQPEFSQPNWVPDYKLGSTTDNSVLCMPPSATDYNKARTCAPQWSFSYSFTFSLDIVTFGGECAGQPGWQST
jgi:hypothetical protein